MHALEKQVLALAGLFQAVSSVKRLAWEGQQDTESVTALLNSVLFLDAPDVETIYGGVNGVSQGLNMLSQTVGNRVSTTDREVIQYAYTIMLLEKKLSKSPVMLKEIGTRIEALKQQMAVYEYTVTDENVIAKMADIYFSTVSKLQPKVMVKGEHLHLQNTQNVHLIRALLLAAMRSAILWRQLGGSRLGLLFKRKKLLQAVQSLQKRCL